MTFLLSCISCDYDNQLVPHFINHYLDLGINKKNFLLILNYQKEKNKNKIEKILYSYNIETKMLWKGDFDSINACIKKIELQKKYVSNNDWILHTDLDEFHIYPTNLDDFVKGCDIKGINAVQGPMIDKIAKNYKFQKITKENIWKQFPISVDILGKIKKSSYYKVMLYKGYLYSKEANHKLDEESDKKAVWYHGKKLHNGFKTNRCNYSPYFYIDGNNKTKIELCYEFNNIPLERRLRFDVKIYHFGWTKDTIKKLKTRIKQYKKIDIKWFDGHKRLLDHYKKNGKIEFNTY